MVIQSFALFLVFVIYFFNLKYSPKNRGNNFWTFNQYNLHKTLPYRLQQIIPKMIITIARIRVIHTVGQHSETTQPAPKAIHKKSLLHIFFIVNTTLCCIYYNICKIVLIVTFYQKQSALFNSYSAKIILNLIALRKLIVCCNVDIANIIM